MPRPRYPSDDRRSRPYVRVHLSVRNHPTYGHVFDDPALRGMWLGLLIVARGAHAGKTDDTVTLSVGDICWITGSKQHHHARARLQRLADAMGYVLADVAPTSPPTSGQRRPLRWRVNVRNYERKQGLRSATSPPPTPIPSTDTESSATPRAPRAPSTHATDFAHKFRASMKARTPDAKVPDDLDRWAMEADRMFRIDRRDQVEAIGLAKWLFNDGGPDAAFWRGNVRSVAKFRKQYETLREHRARKPAGGKGGRGTGGESLRDTFDKYYDIASRSGGPTDG